MRRLPVVRHATANQARAKYRACRHPVEKTRWHAAKRLAVPGTVVLHFLPPCIPELQPVEPLWPLVREAVANRSLGRIDRLRGVVRARLGYLARNPGLVRRVVGFHWARRLER
jgi:transposase